MGLLGGLAAGAWHADRRLAQRPARRAMRAGAWGAGPRLRDPSRCPPGWPSPAARRRQCWTVGGLQVPHAIVAYLIFGITTGGWMAPVYAAMSDIVPRAPPLRRRWRSSTSA